MGVSFMRAVEITRAGTPTAVTLAGRSRTTAAPAPTIVPAPM